MNAPFEEKVQEQIERLQTRSLEEIQTQVALKRMAWVQDHRPDLVGQPMTPRQAFELLFFEYMGLCAADLPIEAETERKIVFRSQNPCPTLEACQALGLDTRQVCRLAYEGSTQAFLSQLDPRLRFGRSYDVIRPHAPYCLEWIALDETGIVPSS